MSVSVHPPARAENDEVEFSNSIRLNSWEWFAVALIVLPSLAAAPGLWKDHERFHPEVDYRIPHDLSSDYWLYERWSDLAAGDFDILIVGDSVVWGEYVTRHETLSHYLDAAAGRERYANLGLGGAHPLALYGLLEHYAPAVTRKKVLLHCNPMWWREPKTDLQEAGAEVNHPRLVPQFASSLHAYKEELSPRLGVLAEQRVPLLKWTNHLQQSYFRTDVPNDIPTWTLAHPYANPVQALRQDLPQPDEPLRHAQQPWYESGIDAKDFAWVELEHSLQWQAFRQTVQLLHERRNELFVLVGPFNENMLKPESLQRYRTMQAGIEAWLKSQRLEYLMPPALPSAEYGDASHPLPAGYRRLAQQLANKPFFK